MCYIKMICKLDYTNAKFYCNDTYINTYKIVYNIARLPVVKTVLLASYHLDGYTNVWPPVPKNNI
jgi:hypothetical protein